MSGISNIDLAYQFLKKSKKPVTLMEIWEGIKKEIINNKSDDNDSIADLYGEMVLDNKFALSPLGQWTVAENAKVKNIKAELKTVAIPKKAKHSAMADADDDDDENPEIYDSLFIEEEEDETVQVYYDDDED